jgi:O-antigen ligase
MVTGSVLIATGTLAFFVTNGRNGGTDVLEYMKWLSASLLFVPALCYGPVWVTRARRVFAVSTGLGASFALAATYTSQAQTLLDSLGKLGYLRSADDARYFILNGVSQGQRVTGSYTDPNIAAIFFICGMAACSAINNRVLRPAVRCILLVAAAGTLSRGAMLGATVAVVLFVALSRAGLWRRSLALAVLALGAAVLLSIPATRDRIATTGTSADIGGNDRITQLHTFAQAMGDDWWFGLGFGRPEFRDGAIAYQVNQVANAPLISIYRGGLVAGAGFVAWYATALALGLRLMRTRSKHGRAQGLALVAFVITALTGYGTALIPELVALFSLQIGLCATLAANAVSEPEEAAPSQVGTLVSARLAPLKPEPAETRRAAAWEPLATGPLDDRVRSTQSSGRGTLGAP